MEDYLRIQKPELNYTYEFEVSQLDLMSECLDMHGFAIIKDVLPDQLIDSLKQAVFEGTDPVRELQPGQSRTRHAWIESGSGAWQLLEYELFMRIHRHLLGADQLTIHRSAAIIRMPGNPGQGWHTDWCGFLTQSPKHSGDVLNRGLWPSGAWFYLTGSRPEHGGLCVIEGSHMEGWSGPQGFKMMANKGSFYKEEETEKAYGGFEVPGLVPLFTNPGDMIVFAHRTYHAAFPNQTDEIRLSCGIGFRARHHRIDMPWEIPEIGKRFLADLPLHLQQYTRGYTSIDLDWRG